MRLMTISALAVALLGGTAPAAAQNYPARTVTVVVPFPAGGSVDGVARILVQKLNETVGQHFIVENRAGGASGTVGANAVAKAAPDGYTLMVSASVHVINPFLYKSVPYDVVNDFTPVSLIVDGPLIVSTTPSVPANNLKTSSRSCARTRNIPSAPPASAPPAISPSSCSRATPASTPWSWPTRAPLGAHRPRERADPSACRSDAVLAAPRTRRKDQALGLTSLKRATAAPEIPTVEESGVKGFHFVSWYGLWGPKNLPADISDKLQSDIAKVLALPDVKQRLNTLGFDPIGTGGREFASYIRDEMAKYEKIIKDAKIKVE